MKLNGVSVSNEVYCFKLTCAWVIDGVNSLKLTWSLLLEEMTGANSLTLTCVYVIDDVSCLKLACV